VRRTRPRLVPLRPPAAPGFPGRTRSSGHDTVLALQHAAGNRATGTLLQRKPRRHTSDKVDLKTAETVMGWILRIINELYAGNPSKLPADAVPARYKELLSLWHELTYGKLEGEEFLSRYARASAQTEPIYQAVVRGGGGQWRDLLLLRWFPKHQEFERRKDEQTRILALLKDADPLFWLHYEPTPVSLGEFLETATRKNSREVPLQRPGGIQVGTAKAGITYYASQQEPRLLLWASPTGVFFSLGDQIYMQSLEGFSEDIIIGAVIKAAQDVAPFVELITVVIDIAISLTPVGPLYDLTLASKAAAEGNWKEAALNLLPHVPVGRLAKLTRVGRVAFRAGSKGVQAIERAVAGAATFAGRGLRKVAGKLKRGLWVVTEGASEVGGKKAYYFLDEAESVWRAVPEDEAAAFIACTKCELTRLGKGESQFTTEEIQKHILEETGTTVPVGTRALEETGVTSRALQAVRAKHHLFVQQLRKWFKSKGLDIDRYTIKLAADEHRLIHNEYRWNEIWKDFMKANPQASKREIFAQMRSMLADYGLEGLPIVPYR
jgi:hypothetical protein